MTPQKDLGTGLNRETSPFSFSGTATSRIYTTYRISVLSIKLNRLPTLVLPQHVRLPAWLVKTRKRIADPEKCLVGVTDRELDRMCVLHCRSQKIHPLLLYSQEGFLIFQELFQTERTSR